MHVLICHGQGRLLALVVPPASNVRVPFRRAAAGKLLRNLSYAVLRNRLGASGWRLNSPIACTGPDYRCDAAAAKPRLQLVTLPSAVHLGAKKLVAFLLSPCIIFGRDKRSLFKNSLLLLFLGLY